MTCRPAIGRILAADLTGSIRERERVAEGRMNEVPALNKTLNYYESASEWKPPDRARANPSAFEWPSVGRMPISMHQTDNNTIIVNRHLFWTHLVSTW